MARWEYGNVRTEGSAGGPIRIPRAGGECPSPLRGLIVEVGSVPGFAAPDFLHLPRRGRRETVQHVRWLCCWRLCCGRRGAVRGRDTLGKSPHVRAAPVRRRSCRPVRSLTVVALTASHPLARRFCHGPAVAWRGAGCVVGRKRRERLKPPTTRGGGECGVGGACGGLTRPLPVRDDIRFAILRACVRVHPPGPAGGLSAPARRRAPSYREARCRWHRTSQTFSA